MNSNLPNDISTVNDIDINNNINMFDPNGMNMGMMNQQMGTMMSPIIEPMRERVVQRTIMHEVPQD